MDFLKPALLKRSSMDFCLVLSAPWLLPLLLLPPWGFGIFTGEPLMLTNTFVLLTDLFMGGFCPMEAAGLMEGKVLEIPLVGLSERTGELRLLAGDEGVKSFVGEEMELDEDVFTAGTGGLLDVEDFPPSRKPLPLNGIMFLISCNPEPVVVLEGFPVAEGFFSEVFPSFFPSFFPFFPYPSGSLTLV